MELSELELYLSLGYEHILDPQGYDHILFIAALTIMYTFRDWKKVIALATAFTVGHSLTLALSALDKIVVPSELIEFLIPSSIIITAWINIINHNENQSEKKIIWKYLLALGFGLIHGMGFSNYFKALLGMQENIVAPLFYFNVGIELAQLVIVLFILILDFIFVDLFHVSRRNWILVNSGIIIGISIPILMEKWNILMG